ncbi:MAG TPA: hypothetical protein VFK81_02175 [Terriglobales bacterium]|jgi:hypothetical protein|nr:hypothetical protein [Terriglobales bacterium]
MTGSELRRNSKDLHSQPQPDFFLEWLAPIVAFVVFGGMLLALLCTLLAEQ